MKRIDSFAYDVARNESIVVEVTPVNFNESLFSVRANRDGENWEAEPGSEDQPRFEFTVSKPVNDIEGSPDDAFYDVAIAGENDEGCPCGFKVRKTTANKEPAVEFFVVG
jgi:hypothetical protein